MMATMHYTTHNDNQEHQSLDRQPSLSSTGSFDGSEENNSDRPYFECRYDTQRRHSIKDSFVESFVTDAIRSHRAVVFLRDLENDTTSKFVHNVFAANCRSDELEFYYLDETPPPIADGVQDYLVDKFSESMVSKNCFVFVQGTHVPLWHIQKILAGITAASQRTVR